MKFMGDSHEIPKIFLGCSYEIIELLGKSCIIQMKLFGFCWDFLKEVPKEFIRGFMDNS